VIVQQLIGGRLADIDIGLPVAMIRRDLTAAAAASVIHSGTSAIVLSGCSAPDRSCRRTTPVPRTPIMRPYAAFAAAVGLPNSNSPPVILPVSSALRLPSRDRVASSVPRRHHAGQVSPGASAETRKHILRTAIVEIVAKIVGDTIDLVVHWQGGDHTRLTVPKNRTGRHRWTTEAETGELIRALARQQPDVSIAAASAPAKATPGPKAGCARTAAPTALPCTETARWPSAAS
jgi:hypothetical protein